MIDLRSLIKTTNSIFLVFCFTLISIIEAKGQDCEGGDETEFGINHWVGHAYQLPFFDRRPAKDFVGQPKIYKGKLLEDMLSTDSINFDISFGDTDETAPGNDKKYFQTACDSVQKEYFGITFMSRYTIPDKGVYLITINQDDGSSLRINGVLLHYNWDTFKHNDHGEGKYYFSYEGGEVLDMVVHFFEKIHTNRISFSIQRYYGPGIISRTQAEICTADPNPDPFLSISEAAFVSEKTPLYQWQYARNPEAPDSEWTDIAGATGVTYDIPKYSDNPYAFTGKMYFRRAAYTVDEFNNEYDAPIYTKPIDITLSLASDIPDTSEYGDLQWYGYVYDNAANFDEGDYIGKLIYPRDHINLRANFNEKFGGASGMFGGSGSSSVPGATYIGCSFERETFSVRYKMKMVLTEGIYNFRVGGDDGFRMSIYDGERYLVPVSEGKWAINRWNNGSEVVYELTHDIVVDPSDTLILYFDIEYFENIADNVISFNSFKEPFGILPVEWGQVSGNPCGDYNCIYWESIQEKNTSHFEVERSNDGIQWSGLNQIIPAAGYSTESLHYELKDNGFTGKSTYYRVKQVDLDESIDYSEVIRVDNPHYNRFMPYPFPNPTQNKLRFYSKEEVVRAELISHDYKIHILPEITRVGGNLYEINLENLNNIHYMLTIIKASGEKEVHKIMKK